MSDCCQVPDSTAAADDRCGRCGEKGRSVLRETMESLLKPEARARLTHVPYHFDRTPHCDVVYFSNDADSYFLEHDLTVRVGLKETEPPVSLCYCFGHTAESIRGEIVATGRSTVAARITAEVQAGNCACEVKNPSGRCCLGDVNRAVQQFERETRAEEPVARVEKG